MNSNTLAFIDTSLLVSLFVGQTQEMTAARAAFTELGPTPEIYIAETTPLEWESAIWLRWRMKQLSLDEANRLIELIEIRCASFVRVGLTPWRLQRAKEFIRKHRGEGLKPLDSIQLSCATSIRGGLQVALTRDERLARCFSLEGFTVWP